jgi:hypothetical protein
MPRSGVTRGSRRVALTGAPSSASAPWMIPRCAPRQVRVALGRLAKRAAVQVDGRGVGTQPGREAAVAQHRNDCGDSRLLADRGRGGRPGTVVAVLAAPGCRWTGRRPDRGAWGLGHSCSFPDRRSKNKLRREIVPSMKEQPMSVTPAPAAHPARPSPGRWMRTTGNSGLRSSFATWRRPVGHCPAGVAMTAEAPQARDGGRRADAGPDVPPGADPRRRWYHGLGIAAGVRPRGWSATLFRPVAGPERRAAS